MQTELSPITSQRNSKDENTADGPETSGDAGGKEGGAEDDENKLSKGKNAVKIEYLPLDLSSFQSTKECVRLFKERDLPLHILVNNAAIAWMPFSKAFK